MTRAGEDKVPSPSFGQGNVDPTLQRRELLRNR